MRTIIISLFVFSGVPAFGQIWSATTIPGVSNWDSIALSADGSTIIAAASPPGEVFISTNSGITWLSNNPTAAKVACSPDGTAFAAINQNQVFISTNSGTTWSESTLGYSWESVLFTLDGKKLILWGSGLMVSTNYGATWSNSSLSGGVSAEFGPLAVSSDGTTMVAGGADGIYISTNSGQTWHESVAAGDGGWNSFSCSFDGTRLAAAAGAGNQGISISTNSGATWTQTNDTLSVEWLLAGSGDGMRLIASPFMFPRNPSLYVSANSGFTWTATLTSLTNDVLSAVALSSDGTHLAALDPTTIYLGLWPPPLTIGVANGSIAMSWPAPSRGFVLQQSISLTTTNWAAAPYARVVSNFQNQITIPVSARTLFYRLAGSLSN